MGVKKCTKKHDACVVGLLIYAYYCFFDVLVKSPSSLLKLPIDLIRTISKATFQVKFAASEAISLSM